MQKKNERILVVDDEPDILETVQTVLEEEHYQVQTAVRFPDLSRDPASKPDLILLDLRLSGEDGIIICQHLKRQAYTKDIPIILMSAHLPTQQVIAASGSDDFLAKPFDMDELLTKVVTHLHAA